MAKKTSKKKQKSNKGLMRFLMIVGLLASILFLPLSVLLCIGMAPTLAALLVQVGKSNKSSVVTIGAFNLAGCAHYAFKLFNQGGELEQALNIISDPHTIVVMYAAALVGKGVDWAMTGIVSALMVERGSARLKSIKKRQAELEERWGAKVRGDIPLDEHGFPIENE